MVLKEKEGTENGDTHMVRALNVSTLILGDNVSTEGKVDCINLDSIMEKLAKEFTESLICLAKN